MKRLFAVFAAGLVAACAETGPVEFDEVRFSNGVAAPGTGTLVSFTVPGEETEGYWLGSGIAFDDAPNGSCYESEGTPGFYKNPAGRPAGTSQNAGQCWIDGEESEPIVIEFTAYANHVQARSGNEQLNFGKVCDPDDPDVCSDTWVHYKANSDWSQGKGTLYDSGYFIHLGSIDQAGNVIAGRPIVVTACRAAGDNCVGATIDW